MGSYPVYKFSEIILIKTVLKYEYGVESMQGGTIWVY